jgi:aspartate racemase
MKEKVVGILGGMGPEATIDLFSKIVEESHAKTDYEHLRIIIDCNPKMPSRQDAILHGTENPGPYMAETAKNLENAGADFIIIGANAAHYFYDFVKEAVNIPVLHIIDEAVSKCIEEVPNIKKAGVLASLGAMKTGLYHKSFEKYGVSIIDMPEELMEKVQKSIFVYKYNGVTKEVLSLMNEAIKYLVSNGSQALIMGCTEIPIILKDELVNLPLIDPNLTIAQVAVKFARNQIER